MQIHFAKAEAIMSLVFPWRGEATPLWNKLGCPLLSDFLQLPPLPWAWQGLIVSFGLTGSSLRLAGFDSFHPSPIELPRALPRSSPGAPQVTFTFPISISAGFLGDWHPEWPLLAQNRISLVLRKLPIPSFGKRALSIMNYLVSSLGKGLSLTVASHKLHTFSSHFLGHIFILSLAYSFFFKTTPFQ